MLEYKDKTLKHYKKSFVYLLSLSYDSGNWKVLGSVTLGHFGNCSSSVPLLLSKYGIVCTPSRTDQDTVTVVASR